MVTIASQITGLTIVYSTVYSDADQRKHQSPASLAFVNSPHKSRKMFPLDDVIMYPPHVGCYWGPTSVLQFLTRWGRDKTPLLWKRHLQIKSLEYEIVVFYQKFTDNSGIRLIC